MTLQKYHVVPTEKSALKAALHARCPKCRTGDMFSNDMYGLSSQKMNEVCPHCGFKFEVEPGYFYVAMFVSYALNVALLIATGIGLSLVTDSINPWIYSMVLLFITFLLSPINFRYSRVILLFWLTPGLNYDPKRAQGFKE